ncbi:MAG: right-handed parallel beta-helix repeat-containing protein [Myxococcales bacterium]|nr:right-handed parallel beta-helix repeat-containing protein [Myxococcales bacterium]
MARVTPLIVRSAAVILAGCASTESKGDSSTHPADGATLEDTAATEDAANADSGGPPPLGDTVGDPDPDSDRTDGELGDTNAVVEKALLLRAPMSVPPGRPFPVAVDAEGPVTMDVVLTAGAVHKTVHLHRGRGSASFTLAESITLHATAPGYAGSRDIAVAARPVVELVAANLPSQRLTGGQLFWDATSDVAISGTVVVGPGTTLAVAAGTRVVLGPKAGIEVRGTLKVIGSLDEPVLFTSDSDAAWGGIRVISGAATFDHAWLTAGGGDSGLIFGHSKSQPVIYAEDASLAFEGGGVVDSPGKALGSLRSKVTLTGALISRCDTGGELADSEVLVDTCHVVEIPDADGQYDDDDNDALYIVGTQVKGGVDVQSVVRRSVFRAGEDDGIDHNDATLRIEDSWIEGFQHQGVAASQGHRVEVVGCVIRGCGPGGVEAGYGAPTVIVDHCSISGNETGVKYGDNYDWDAFGSLTVTNSIVVQNQKNVENYVVNLGGPREGAVHVSCSQVDSADLDGLDGNIAGDPVLDAIGCPPPPGAMCDGARIGLEMCP